MQLGRLRDRVRRRIWIGGWSGVHDNTPSSYDVDPLLTQVNLLGTGPGLLSFSLSGVARGSGFSTTLKRLICKKRLHLLLLNTAPVILLVVTP
jgi:hypothetical protein